MIELHGRFGGVIDIPLFAALLDGRMGDKRELGHMVVTWTVVAGFYSVLVAAVKRRDYRIFTDIFLTWVVHLSNS